MAMLLKNFRMPQQENKDRCWAAVIQMLRNGYHPCIPSLSQDEIVDWLLGSGSGARRDESYNLVLALFRMGHLAGFLDWKLVSFEMIAHQLDQGKPVVLEIWLDGNETQRHAVAVVGIGDEKTKALRVEDPDGFAFGSTKILTFDRLAKFGYYPSSAASLALFTQRSPKPSQIFP